MSIDVFNFSSLKGKIVKACVKDPYDSYYGEDLVGVVENKPVEKGSKDELYYDIISVFRYRVVVDGKVRGREEYKYFFHRIGSSSNRIRNWQFDLVEDKQLIESWNSADRNASIRKDRVKALKDPFENLVQELKDNNVFGNLVEVGLGDAAHFILKQKFVLGRKKLSLKYNVGHNGKVEGLGLDSLNEVEKTVRELGDQRSLVLRYSRLTTQGNRLVQEFFFE